MVSSVSGKIKSFQKEKNYKSFTFTLHRRHPLEEGAPIFTFNHILFIPPTKNPGPVRMGHTPYARYIYLGFGSEVGWGFVNQYRVADFLRLIKNV